MLPVIVLLDSIQQCEEYEVAFENCFVFGRGRVFAQISCLKDIQSIVKEPWPVILTTSEASLGHDFTSVAYVI